MNRRRRVLKKQMSNILHHSSLTIIPKLKGTTRLNQRLVPNTTDHDDNLDASSSPDIKSDNSSTSSSYQPSHSSSYDKSIHSSLKTKFFPCKIILFPKQLQPEDHSQSSSININKIHLQTNHRSPFTFLLIFSKINPNIITLKLITTSNTPQNEDISLAICRPIICHVHISPISSPPSSPRHNTYIVYTTIPNHQETLTYTSTSTQQKDLTMRSYHPLRHQQGIWSMHRIQTYYPLYHDGVHNAPPVDHELQHHTPSTLPSKKPIIKSNILSVQPCTKRNMLSIQKLYTIIYTYRYDHKKTIKFIIPSLYLPSNSPTTTPVSPYTVINQTFNFHCIPIKSLQEKPYPRPIQNILTHVIHNNNICHPLVLYTDLLKPIPLTPPTPQMMCLTTIKMRIAPTKTNVPFIRPFQLRCGHIRSIRFTPTCIHNKQKPRQLKGIAYPITKKLIQQH